MLFSRNAERRFTKGYVRKCVRSHVREVSTKAFSVVVSEPDQVEDPGASNGSNSPPGRPWRLRLPPEHAPEPS